MDLITDEFLSARTREPLAARLWKSDKFQQHMKSLHKASQAFTKDTSISKKDQKLYDRLEEEWSEYNIAYGEESYQLGFDDGVRLASERRIRLEGSVLSVKDMTHLVYMYDAVKQLNKFLLGVWDIHERESGILEELGRVCDVIENGTCAEIRLRGEDEMYEYLADKGLAKGIKNIPCVGRYKKEMTRFMQLFFLVGITGIVFYWHGFICVFSLFLLGESVFCKIFDFSCQIL